MSAIFPGLPRPLLFAHRGASRQAPENTLEAFELGSRLGAHVLEMDVHQTRDGEIVVMHDTSVDRTTSGHGLIKEQTFQQIAELDAGYHFETDHGARPFRGRSIEVPRLEEVLRSFPQSAFNIEIKQHDPPIIKPVLEVLARVGTERVLLAAANHAIMSDLERAKPGCALGLSAVQASGVLREAYFGTINADLRGRALQVPPFYRGLPVLTGRVLRCAREAGLEVHVWTINSQPRAQRLLRRGVDGIMSDDPGALHRLFAAPTQQIRQGGLG